MSNGQTRWLLSVGWRRAASKTHSETIIRYWFVVLRIVEGIFDLILEYFIRVFRSIWQSRTRYNKFIPSSRRSP